MTMREIKENLENTEIISSEPGYTELTTIVNI